jgi:predicted nucleic acid-binding protein
MGIKDASTILIDTNCFIYYFEDNEIYADKLEEMFTKIQNGEIKAYMSVLSLLELLVKPKKDGNIFLENRYKLTLMNYPNLKIIDVSVGIADVAATLRAEHNIKTPDAIILATALHFNVDSFVTNDTRLKDICESKGLPLMGLDV